MIVYVNRRKPGVSFRLVVFFLVTTVFVYGSIGCAYSPKEKIPVSVPSSMPSPEKLITTTAHVNLPVLRGIQLDSRDPFQFNFIIDEGGQQLSEEKLKEESARLIKYFLSSLTIAEQDLWVNLSPYEGNKIVPESLGLTEMGKDLLGQDYILKQLMASLTYPETELGRDFWFRVYQRAQSLFGTTKIPINTFNKIWIVPEKAVVYEDKDRALVGETKLKVMMEEDYLLLKDNMGNTDIKKSKLNETEVSDINNFSSQIMKEVILPVIEEEVNEGENFAMLRQIYHSLILAVWFKQKLKENIINRIYSDQNKIKGVDTANPDIKDKIYDQYVQAYQKGAYDYIKKDYDTTTRKTIRRRYFSGGFDGTSVSSAIQIAPLKQSVYTFLTLLGSYPIMLKMKLLPQIGRPKNDFAQGTGLNNEYIQAENGDGVLGSGSVKPEENIPFEIRDVYRRGEEIPYFIKDLTTALLAHLPENLQAKLKNKVKRINVGLLPLYLQDDDGAYSNEEVYISEGILRGRNPGIIAEVFFHEFGHALLNDEFPDVDQQVCADFLAIYVVGGANLQFFPRSQRSQTEYLKFKNKVEDLLGNNSAITEQVKEITERAKKEWYSKLNKRLNLPEKIGLDEIEDVREFYPEIEGIVDEYNTTENPIERDGVLATIRFIRDALATPVREFSGKALFFMPDDLVEKIELECNVFIGKNTAVTPDNEIPYSIMEIWKNKLNVELKHPLKSNISPSRKIAKTFKDLSEQKIDYKQAISIITKEIMELTFITEMDNMELLVSFILDSSTEKQYIQNNYYPLKSGIEEFQYLITHKEIILKKMDFENYGLEDQRLIDGIFSKIVVLVEVFSSSVSTDTVDGNNRVSSPANAKIIDLWGKGYIDALKRKAEISKERYNKLIEKGASAAVLKAQKKTIQLVEDYVILATWRIEKLKELVGGCSLAEALKQVDGGAVRELSNQQELALGVVEEELKEYSGIRFDKAHVLFLSKESWLSDLFEMGERTGGKYVDFSQGGIDDYLIAVDAGLKSLPQIVKILLHEVFHAKYLRGQESVYENLFPEIAIYEIFNEATVEEEAIRAMSRLCARNVQLRNEILSGQTGGDLASDFIAARIIGTLIFRTYSRERKFLNTIFDLWGQEAQTRVNKFLTEGDSIASLFGENWDVIELITMDFGLDKGTYQYYLGIQMMTKALQQNIAQPDAPLKNYLHTGKKLIDIFLDAELGDDIAAKEIMFDPSRSRYKSFPSLVAACKYKAAMKSFDEVLTETVDLSKLEDNFKQYSLEGINSAVSLGDKDEGGHVSSAIENRENNRGGIDLNPQEMDLEIQGEGIQSFPMINIPFDLDNFQGFTFQILNINRIDNVENLFAEKSR